MKRCSNCRLFLGSTGERCERSEGLQSTCKDHEAGHPFHPHFQDSPIDEIEFNPEEPGAWSFWIGEDQVLMLVWEIDHNLYGHFRIFMVELDDKGVVRKQFSVDTVAPEFSGSVSVKGPKGNDLWASFDCRDDDQIDGDGNVVNKPREVKVYPRRKQS